MKIGQLVRETHTVPARHGAITEEQAICFFDRSSIFSQYIDPGTADENLTLLFAHPAHGSTHAGYVAESNKWTMVYRHYPRPAERSTRSAYEAYDWYVK